MEIFIPERRNLNLATEEAHEIMVIEFNILCSSCDGVRGVHWGMVKDTCQHDIFSLRFD